MATTYANLATGHISTFTAVAVGDNPPIPPPSTSTTTTAVPEWEQDCPGFSHQVVYHGDGDASHAMFTIEVAGGTQQGDYALPLQHDNGELGLSFCAGAGTFVYISVQNPNDSGSVSCRMEVDGVTVAEVESSGGYVIATCNASVPETSDLQPD